MNRRDFLSLATATFALAAIPSLAVALTPAVVNGELTTDTAVIVRQYSRLYAFTTTSDDVFIEPKRASHKGPISRKAHWMRND